MKKFIALLLVAIMAITAVIPAMAAENNETAPDAPVFVGAQTRDSETENSSDVRFIATVSSLKGTCVGYKVVANYYSVGAETPDTTVTYDGEDTESAKVYTSVLDNGVSKTADDLTPGALGIYVMTITGVPNAQSVDFTVTAYVKYNNETISSTAKYERYENGEIMVVNTYSQDFNTSKTNTQVLNEAGIYNLYGGSMPLSITNGKLYIPNTTWGTGPFAQLIGRDAFASAPSKYLLEMDLEITRYKNIAIMFNGTADESEDTSHKRSGAAVIQFKIDGNSNGSLSSLGGKKFYVRTGYNYNGNQTIADAYGAAAYTIPTKVSNNNVTATMKISLVVDSSVTNGCDIHIFVNGSYLSTRTLRGDGYDGDAAFDVSANSYVSIWAEGSEATIDNLKVSTFTDAVGTTLPTSVTPIYSQDFENCTDLLDECGISQTFGNKYCATGLPLNVTDSGTLSVGSHAWHTDADYFATLVDSGKINACQTYFLEMEISDISSANTPFTILMVNNSDKSNSTALNSDALSVRLMTDETSKALTGTLRVGVYPASGDATNTDYKSDVTGIASGATSIKLGIMVDSTPENGTVIKLYVSGNLVATQYVADNNKDANNNTSIVLWAQQLSCTIDNITLKTYSSPTAA